MTNVIVTCATNMIGTDLIKVAHKDEGIDHIYEKMIHNNIALRALKEKDAPLMIEWMHDPQIQKCFQKSMERLTLDDALLFCREARKTKKIAHGESIHLAIAGENDEYLGTISLKNIDLRNKNAEYAIALRKSAMGKGIASRATKMLLKKAFFEMGLHRIYLNVLSDNQPAIRLYEKNGFVFEGEFLQHLKKGDEYMNLKWYGILRMEYEKTLYLQWFRDCEGGGVSIISFMHRRPGRMVVA